MSNFPPEQLISDYVNLVDVLVWHLIENNVPPCSSFHEGTDLARSHYRNNFHGPNFGDEESAKIQEYLDASQRASGIMSVEEVKELLSDPNYQG